MSMQSEIDRSVERCGPHRATLGMSPSQLYICAAPIRDQRLSSSRVLIFNVHRAENMKSKTSVGKCCRTASEGRRLRFRTLCVCGWSQQDSLHSPGHDRGFKDPIL